MRNFIRQRGRKLESKGNGATAVNDKAVERKKALRALLGIFVEAAVFVIVFLAAKSWLRETGTLTAQQADIFYFTSVVIGFLVWRAIKRSFGRHTHQHPLRGLRG